MVMKSLVVSLCLSAALGFAPQTSHKFVAPSSFSLRKSTHSIRPLQVSSNKKSPHHYLPNGLRHQAQRGGQSLWDSVNGVATRIDNVGSSLKPKAKQASVQYTTANTTGKRIGYLLKAFALYTIYLFYRGIKGVIVAMPPVYQQLYAKFSNMVEYPFEDSVITRDVNPQTGKLRWRTKFNVGLLATTLCASYIATGALRVAVAFGQEIKHSRSLVDSLMAAVEKQEENEDKMLRMGKRPLPKPKNYF